MLLVVLKVVHFYALMLGATTGIANGIWLSWLARHRGPPPELVPQFMALLGRLGFLAIVILWLSGLALAGLIYGTLLLGWVFYLKLVAATAVLGLVLALGALGGRAQREGRAPDLSAMKTLSALTSGAVLVAVISAVVVFN